MKAIKLACFTVVGTLLLSVNVLAVVYDHEGKSITEDEIEKEMDEMYRIGKHPGRGCVIGGCISGFISGGLGLIIIGAAGIGEDVELQKNAQILGGALGVAGVAVAVLGVVMRDRIYKKEAIERIKERRRSQRQNEDKESLVPESIIALPFLSGSF